MKRIYVAGPFSSDPIGNTARAIAAASELRVAGFHPFVPHTACQWAADAAGYEAAMVECMAWLGVCDAVLRIPGESSGADREVKHALAAGIPVFYGLVHLMAHARREGWLIGHVKVARP